MITIGVDFYRNQEERVNPYTGELSTFNLGIFSGVATINNDEQKLLLPMVSGDTIDETLKRVILVLEGLQKETTKTIDILKGQLKNGAYE